MGDVQLLSQGRFRLGLGSGENLNEHVVGGGWPAAHVRLARLEEAVEIIRALFAGENVNHHGDHFDVENATCGTCPTRPRRSGSRSRATVRANSPAVSPTS